MIRTTVADLQCLLRDMPPEMPVDFCEAPNERPYPPDLIGRLSLVHAHLHRAKEVLGVLLQEMK